MGSAVLGLLLAGGLAGGPGQGAQVLVLARRAAVLSWRGWAVDFGQGGYVEDRLQFAGQHQWGETGGLPAQALLAGLILPLS